MEDNWAGSIMNIIDRVIKLIVLNLLWMLFTLLGLVAFGIVPATATVFIIIRKWINDEVTPNLFQEFWNNFKESFVSSNLVGLVFIGVGLFLYIDINILLGSNILIIKILLSLLFMLCLLYIATLLNFFPLYARYRMSSINYLKLSLVVGLSNPITTLLMMLWLLVVAVLTLRYTVLIPLVMISLICVGVNWLSMKRLEKKPLYEE